MPTDTEVDQLLVAAGEAWRTGVPTADRLDSRALQIRSRGSRPRWVSGQVAIAFSLVALVFAVLPFLRAADSTTPIVGAGATRDEASPQDGAVYPIVLPGDEVIGEGNLVQQGDGFLLCPPTLLSADGGPVCQRGQSVHVEGVDQSRIPGSDGTRGWVSDYVSVRGRWDGTALSVLDVATAAPPERATIPSAPCQAPANGWTRPADPETAESAGRALEDFVDQYPSRFSGIWSAPVSDAGDRDMTRVTVVGTVEDQGAVEEDLHVVYPYDVCVTRVMFSRAQLQEVIRALSASALSGQIELDPALDKVVVSIVVVDRRAADALAQFRDQVQIRALLSRAP